MKLKYIIEELERVAHPSLQESYDNSGLIIGNLDSEVNKALLCLDSTEEIVDEAIKNGCDLIVAHHPIVFKGLKRFNGANYVQRTVMKAIKNGISIYACHTNLDNVLRHGVNMKIAEKLGLQNAQILNPMSGEIRKLAVFIPITHLDEMRNALFAAGAGQIGAYDECGFSSVGEGTFRGSEGTNPYVGQPGKRHNEVESKLEVIYPKYLEAGILRAMRDVHPYEEVAFDVVVLQNQSSDTGSGVIGDLTESFSPSEFLAHLKVRMDVPCIRFTKSDSEQISRIAICGGAGSFLIGRAIKSGAHAFVTADIKYHEFFDAEQTLMLCDIGHYESERFTPEIFAGILSEKFPNFATIFAKTITNPVNYYI